MVSAGILSKSPVAISTSSSKIKGVARPPKVDTPRIKNSEAVPGSPLLVLTITPANLPAIELVNEELGALSSNPFTVEIAPVTLTFFLCSRSDNHYFVQHLIIGSQLDIDNT